MFFLSKYFTGKGLNLSEENISKYPKVNTYKVPVIPKYNFIVVDFEKILHQESDLFNFGRALKETGVLIIRQKITHEECYGEVLYHADLLHKINTSLISFEPNEEHNYFIFRKESRKQSLFLGAYSIDKNKILKAVTEIEKSFLYTK